MLHVQVEPTYKTELETFGHQKNKLIEPVYKTEIATSCKPTVERRYHVAADIKLPVPTLTEVHHTITRAEQPRFIGTVYDVHTNTLSERKTTSTIVNDLCDYATVSSKTSTYSKPSEVHGHY